MWYIELVLRLLLVLGGSTLIVGGLQCPRICLGILDQDPSDSNPVGYMFTSFGFTFIQERVCSIDSSKMTINSSEVSNYNK